ncbi:uncharacterized protein [Amphiura filiformis]|uniref:uncharacterized protein n=1 Tax=Amphiura filiformis TaxID=82378 RepID=UPI003B2137D4
MQIYIKPAPGTDGSTFIPYANNAVILVPPGVIDFRCEVTNSDPVVDISWTVSGDSYTEDGDSSSSTNVGNGLFDYNSFILGHDFQACAQVTCTASNDAITELDQEASWTRTVNIQVLAPPNEPTITLDPSSTADWGSNPIDNLYNLLEGNTYVFNCQVTGADPEASIQWTLYNKDDEPIIGGTQTNAAQESLPDCDLETNEESYTLSASQVQHTLIHDGYLVCKAFNDNYNDGNGGSTMARVNFKVLKRNDLALRYRQGTGPYTDVNHNGYVYTTPGTLYDFQCEASNVFPATESSPSFDATDLFFYYDTTSDTDFNPGLRVDNEPGLPSQDIESLYDLTDQYQVTSSIGDSCPAELRCVSIYDVTDPRPATDPTLAPDSSYISALLVHSSVTSSVEITPPTFSEFVRGQVINGDTLQLYEGDTYLMTCRTQGADPDEDILWTIDDCNGGSVTVLRQRQYTEENANCVAQDDADVLDFSPRFPLEQGFCLRCTSGGLSHEYTLDIIPLSGICPATSAVIWEYTGSNSNKRPFYYTEDELLPGFTQPTVIINAEEERQLNCTSYESAPVTYIAWRTPSATLDTDKFISSDCAYVYEESAVSSQVSVTKYDTTKCVNLVLDYDWHRAQIQCTATNIADLSGVNSLAVNVYLCVPCEVNLELIAYNFQGNPYHVNHGSGISLKANGEPRTMSCINRGARGLESNDKPWIDIQIKEAGSSRYVTLTEADGVELVYERRLSDDPQYSEAKYENLWEVRKDITLSAESNFNLEGAVLSCFCRNRVYGRISEARQEATLRVFDTPLIDGNFFMVQGYPNYLDDVSNTDVVVVTYGPFDSESDRKKREAAEILQLTCIARGTRPAVDITWRLDSDIISDEFTEVSIENSVLNIGAGQQLVDTISTLTFDDVLREFHYKNVTCEAASGSGGLIVRSARIIVLSPPDTPLELDGEYVVQEGERVTLECEAVNGYPEGVFQWNDVKRGVILAADRHETELLENYRYEQESYFSFVASKEDNGRVISCEFLQDHDEYGFTALTTTQSIEISVNYCPSTSAQLTGCPNTPILPGQPITIACQSGITDPASYLAYLVDDVELPPSLPTSTVEMGYGHVTTQHLTRAFSASDSGVKVQCCHRTIVDGMACPGFCSDDCTISVQDENPIPPGQGCRWVRIRLTLENINGNNAAWEEAYENRLSSEYQYLTSRLIDVFKQVYDVLPDHRSTVIPIIRRAPEDLIQVMIGLEFHYPYGSSLPAIRQALTSRLDVNGVIRVDQDYGYAFDVLPDSIGEECVCPQTFCLRGPSCVPSEEDYSSSCQCPNNYAPPRCEPIEPPPNPTRGPEPGVTYARLVFILSEIDDRPVFWDPIYDDIYSNEARSVRDGLQLVLYQALSRTFPCLQKVVVADLFEMYGRNLAVIAGFEFYYDCGNSINAIRNAFIQSVDVDGKIDGSTYELRQDFIFDIGLEEVCSPYFSCANGGVCEPSTEEYSSSCRCPPDYTGSRCERIVIVDRPTQRPPRPTEEREPEPQRDYITIIIVASVMAAVILIGVIVCVSLWCCRPTTRRTHYVERHAHRVPTHNHRAGGGRGRPVRTSYDRNYDRKSRLIY